MVVGQLYKCAAGCTAAYCMTLMASLHGVGSDLMAAYLLQLFLYIIVLVDTELKAEIGSKRFWGWAKKITAILSPMDTRKFWLMGRSVSQMVGVMMPSRSSMVPSKQHFQRQLGDGAVEGRTVFFCHG